MPLGIWYVDFSAGVDESLQTFDAALYGGLVRGSQFIVIHTVVKGEKNTMFLYLSDVQK